MATHCARFDSLHDALAPHRIDLTRELGTSSPSTRKAHSTFEATDDTGAKLVVQAYSRSSLRTGSFNELLTYSSLSHPHLVPPKRLIPTPSHLCVLTDAVQGGDIFSMTRRTHTGALQPAAARFIFQQVAVTAEFLQRSRMHLHEVNPSSFLVHWNSRNMPIVKVLALSLPRDILRAEAAGRRGGNNVVCTMLTSPHVIRRETVGAGADEQERFACAGDSWAMAVVLYFLLYGRWPFSRQQMQRWVTGHPWIDDASVDYRGIDGGPAPAPDAVPLLQAVFAYGRFPAAEFSRRCPTVSAIVRDAWVATDLPEGAEDMTDTFWDQTCKRQSNTEFCTLQQSIAEVLCVEPSLLSLPAPAPAAQPIAPHAHMSAPSARGQFPFHLPPIAGYPPAMGRGMSSPAGPVA